MAETLIVDSMDKPNAGTTGRNPHQMISYIDAPAPRRRTIHLPWQMWCIVGVLIIGLAGYLVVTLSSAVRLWFLYHPGVGELLGWLLVAAIVVPVLAVLYVISGAAYWRVRRWAAEVYQAQVVRTRLGNPVDVASLIGQQAALMVQLEQMHIALESVRAPYTQYPMLQNLDQGQNTHESAQTTINTPAEPQPPALPQNTPVLDHLLQIGHICRSGNSVMVGYDTEQKPHYIELNNAPVVGVAGASQYGKSSAVRFALAQMALNPEPVGIVMCDPHGSIQEKSLAVSCKALERAYLMPVAITPDDIMATVRQVAQIGDARLNGRDLSKFQIVLVIDEFTALMNRGGAYAGEMARLLLRFGNEFGKAGLSTFLIGQSWNADLAGGTALRNAIQATIVYGCKRHQAAFLLSNEEAKQAETLQKGTGDALFKPHWADDMVRVKVPWVSASDLDIIKDRVRPAPALPRPEPAPRKPDDIIQRVRSLPMDQREMWVRQAARVRGDTQTGYKYGTRLLQRVSGLDYNRVVALCAEERAQYQQRAA